MIIFIVSAVSLLISYWLILYRLRPSRNVLLPPSPPAYPLIGHLPMIPPKHTDVFFYELSKKYGKVVSLQIPGRTLVVLNSAKAAIDLLDKRSAIYSDRAVSTMMLLMGWRNNLVFTPYGKECSTYRKLLSECFNQKRCQSYKSFQLIEASRLVHGFSTTPDDFITHISRFSAAMILRVVYGHEISSIDDPYVKITSDAGYCIANCAVPGNNPLDIFPFLQHLPSWFPGTEAATQARAFRPAVDRIHEYPFDDVKRQMEEGTAIESFLSTHLEGLRREGDRYPYTVDEIRGVAAVSYTAGSDTTWATILIFVLALVLHPECQSQAQEEMDRVLGGVRLPQFEDRTSLPYMECLLQETYRWHNAAPLGVPHRSTEDDIYEGMFIPQGSIVIVNARGMSLDEDVYRDPHIFDPTRYQRGEPFMSSQYGFGRRICPGRHLADASVWIAAASIISALTISPARDEQGCQIIPKEEFVSAITCHPKFFKCRISPRNNIVDLDA